MTEPSDMNEHCMSCVYYPPNLPACAYSEEDHRMLREKNCSFDLRPGDEHCRATRKTSCSLLDLENISKATSTRERPQ